MPGTRLPRRARRSGWRAPPRATFFVIETALVNALDDATRALFWQVSAHVKLRQYLLHPLTIP